jgi:hypothetical protein
MEKWYKSDFASLSPDGMSIGRGLPPGIGETPYSVMPINSNSFTKWQAA